MNLKAACRTVPVGIFFSIALLVIFRLATTPTAIYALDEYAYLKLGRDFGEVAVAAQMERDPGLQQLSNHVYFWIVHIAGRLSGNPVPAIRVMNFTCYFVIIPLLAAWLFRRRSEDGAGRESCGRASGFQGDRRAEHHSGHDPRGDE